MTPQKVWSRMYSALSVEDIQPMSNVFTTWSDVLKVGTLVVGVSQAFLAAQLQLNKFSSDKLVTDLKQEVHKDLMATKKDTEELNKELKEVKKDLESMATKMDQVLAKKP